MRDRAVSVGDPARATAPALVQLTGRDRRVDLQAPSSASAPAASVALRVRVSVPLVPSESTKSPETAFTYLCMAVSPTSPSLSNCSTSGRCSVTRGARSPRACRPQRQEPWVFRASSRPPRVRPPPRPTRRRTTASGESGRLGRGARDARNSSRANVRAGSAETAASTGSSSAPVHWAHPSAPVSCMDTSSAGPAAALHECRSGRSLRSRAAGRVQLVPGRSVGASCRGARFTPLCGSCACVERMAADAATLPGLERAM